MNYKLNEKIKSGDDFSTIQKIAFDSRRSTVISFLNPFSYRANPSPILSTNINSSLLFISSKVNHFLDFLLILFVSIYSLRPAIFQSMSRSGLKPESSSKPQFAEISKFNFDYLMKLLQILIFLLNYI